MYPNNGSNKNVVVGLLLIFIIILIDKGIICPEQLKGLFSLVLMTEWDILFKRVVDIVVFWEVLTLKHELPSIVKDFELSGNLQNILAFSAYGVVIISFALVLFLVI